MARIPTTSETLLRDLSGDSQHARWGELVTRYRPMLEAYMRERFPSVEADEAIRRRHWLRNGLIGAGVVVVLALLIGLVVLFSEPSLPAVLNLRGQTLVRHEPIVLKPGRTYRVIGPWTLDADISVRSRPRCG